MLASVRSPRTLIFIWNFVGMCARASEPCFFDYVHNNDPPRGRWISISRHKNGGLWIYIPQSNVE